jgi:hypothetical protein
MSEASQNRENSPEPDIVGKNEAISLLRRTIVQLENIVTQLESESLQNIPPNSFATLLDSTDKIAAEIQSFSESDNTEARKAEELEDFVKDGDDTDTVIEPEVQTSPFGRRRSWWGKFLLQIRGFLPSSLSDRLSDTILTGIVASIAIVFSLFSFNLIPSFPDAQPTVSTTVSDTIEPPAEIAENPASKTDLPTTETTPELESKPTKTPEKIAKPVPLELTPEQSLVASIQEQVAEITNRYSAEIISAIEADFLGGRLLITVTDKWQDLRIGRQEKLANEMLDRAHRLDFNKMEIIDKDRNVLARSPVVGSKMVLVP